MLTVTCFLLGVVQLSTGSNTGTQTWGQPCNPAAGTSDDPSTRCDTSKRLSCGANARTCKCHHEERDFYNRAEDRCETKIGMFCSGGETFPERCAKNAVCNAHNNFCECVQGGTPNEDMTACIKENDDDQTNSATSQGFHALVPLAAFAIAGLWL